MKYYLLESMDQRTIIFAWLAGNIVEEKGTNK